MSQRPLHYLKPLVKLQKTAIRIISSAPHNAHTEPLFKKLNILPLHLLIDFFKIQFMHQFKNKFLPTSFDSTWITNVQRMQNLNDFNLRNTDEYFVPFARINICERLPLTSFPRAWNEFSDDNIKIIRCKIEFNVKLKLFLINSLNEVIICERLFCPACHRIS